MPEEVTSRTAEVQDEKEEVHIRAEVNIDMLQNDATVKIEPEDIEEEIYQSSTLPISSLLSVKEEASNDGFPMAKSVVESNIEGNVELSETTPQAQSVIPKIKINLSVGQAKRDEGNEEEISEEQQLQELKPRLVGRKLTNMPPKMKGSEISALCSIM